jgi:20S proteasome alpha/beta subunit
VTVCIAAIYNKNSIIGVSDRMITAGDIQFQPPARKIIPVTSSIVIMTAGDANVQQQLLTATSTYIDKRLAVDSKTWIPVKDIANFYRNRYTEINAEEAEKAILVPQGLTFETFLRKQKEMSQEYISDLAYKLQRFAIDDIATIVAGVDDEGAHIYTVRNGEVSWDNKVGFSAVGIGSNHALSHIMLSGYSKDATETKALLTVHQAKKRAEVSPGVGQDTDMFLTGPAPGTFMMLEPLHATKVDIVKGLDNFYAKYQKAIDRLDKNIESKIKVYIETIISTPSAEQQAETFPITSLSTENKTGKSNGKAAKKTK